MNIQSCMYPIKQFHSSNWKPTLFITRWWGRNKKLNCWPIGAWKSHAGLSVYTVGILLAKWGWIPALDQWVLSPVIVSLWAPTTQTPSFQQHHPSWHGLQAQYRIIPVHRPNLKPPSHSADLVHITVINLPDSIKFGMWSIMDKNTFSLHPENMSVCILLCESMWLWLYVKIYLHAQSVCSHVNMKWTTNVQYFYKSSHSFITLFTIIPKQLYRKSSCNNALVLLKG